MVLLDTCREEEVEVQCRWNMVREDVRKSVAVSRRGRVHPMIRFLSAVSQKEAKEPGI